MIECVANTRMNALRVTVAAFFITLLAVSAAETNSNEGLLVGFSKSGQFDEQTLTYTNNTGVRVHINAPARIPSGKPIKLAFFSLPNGNTIEQTIGKKMNPGDDWHFNIQHIGAQTRFIRRALTNETLIVAYLENNLKSWPAWRKAHGDKDIPEILSAVEKHIPNFTGKICLTGHSGGGSMIFGYLNAVTNIPDRVERIVFLDSNYAYDTNLHHDKLVRWLNASKDHRLLVFAYHDDIALLNGKTFVSAAGGTWGKSHQMRRDFDADFKFTERASGEIKIWSALDGRLQMFLKENPEKKIYHTVQVERNGFIHALSAGTSADEKGYSYFGPHAYDEFIGSE